MDGGKNTNLGSVPVKHIHKHKTDHICTDEASEQQQTWKSTAPEEKGHVYYLKISRVHLTPGDVNALIYRHKDNNLKFIYSDAL